MKNTERFSDRVANYVRYRPHYPTELIAFLKEQIGLDTHWIIADIGSGTGISSELFLANGNRVYGVEPNKEMRIAAEEKFKKDRHFISTHATAEATSLPSHSIDLIVVGQAFHWFNQALAKKEFQRIAKPDAYLALLWNIRKVDSPFQQAYEQLLEEFALDYKEVNLGQVGEQAIRQLFSPHPYALEVFNNSQSFDFEGLKGRLLSSSYAPLESHPQYKPMIYRLQQLFDQFNVDSEVKFEYSCKLYYGKI